MALQTDYTPRQQAFFVGFPTVPFADCYTLRSTIYVPTSGTAPKPGDAVVYDATRDKFRLPTTATEASQLDGIIVLSQQTRGVEYADNDPIIVMQRGSLAVIAGGAVDYRDIVQWQTDDQKWDSYDHEITVADRTGTVNLALLNTTINAFESEINDALAVETKIKCISYAGAADTDIMEISIDIF